MLLADSSKQERIEELLRKSLLGEELVNTQFHLFSARSVPSSRLTKPRVLCANNVLLAKSSKYFLDLLSSDTNPSDPSLNDLTDASNVPSDVRIDDYGYGSDSDLDDDDGEPPIPIADTEAPKNYSAMVSAPPPAPPQINIHAKLKDNDELSEDGSESVSSDIFVMSPEHPRIDEPFITNMAKPGSIMSSETAVQEARDSRIMTGHTSKHPRYSGSRHILVKDAAFQTWYTLLNYLYTGKINFLPLSSATPGMQTRESSTSFLDEPRCSAKSMYRLACKIGLDHLRNEALVHIRNDLSEQNILKELSCSLTSKHSQVLEMELDVLYTHIASPPIVTEFPALARRIANKEVPHGADIVIGIYSRLLRGRPSPRALPQSPPHPLTPFSQTPLHPSVSLRGSPTPVAHDLNDTIEIAVEPPHAYDWNNVFQLSEPPSESNTLLLNADAEPAVEDDIQDDVWHAKKGSKGKVPPMRGKKKLKQ